MINLQSAAAWLTIRFHENCSHFRDKDKVEVDFVLESRGKAAGIEAKASSTVTPDDFKGLRKLQNAVQQRFALGVVLYDGEAAVPFGQHLYAVPISALWEKIGCRIPGGARIMTRLWRVYDEKTRA